MKPHPNSSDGRAVSPRPPRWFVFLALALAATFATTATLHAQTEPPNTGWTQWSATYKLQNWTTMPDSAVFKDYGTGEYWIQLTTNTWDPGTTGRVEMRWPDWPDQQTENMISADVMYEAGTDGTCIMQIKTNTGDGGGGHESIYLNVKNNGNLYHGVNNTVIIQNGFGQWHNVKAAYNPITGLARVWIDDVLKFTQTYAPGTGAVWYFKTGAYWASAVSTVHYKNITFWVNRAIDPAQGIIFEAESLPRAVIGDGTATNKSDALASAGVHVQLENDTVGSAMEFTLPSAFPAGAYRVVVRGKTHPNRGIAQLSIDGNITGSPWNQYYANTAGLYATNDFGVVRLAAGSHTLRLTAIDTTAPSTNAARYNLSADYFQFIPDTTPPMINCPDDMTVNATAPNGANVTFAVTAADSTGAPIPSANITATPASGSLFPIGETTVQVKATDPSNKTTATDSFVVTVLNTALPTPTVTSVSPTTAMPGDTITITGVNLTGASVTIGGVTAIVVSNDGTTLKVTVPANANTGTIVITTTGGNVPLTQTLIITPASSITTEPYTALVTLAGTPGTSGSTNGTGTTALFCYPIGLVADAAGNLYIADSANNDIRRFAPNGQISTLAGSPNSSGATDSSGATALFYNPSALAISPNGTTLYVADQSNDAIRAINLATSQVTTLATTGLNNPCGLAVDAAGNLYIANAYVSTIIKIAAATGAQTTIATAAAGLSAPVGLALSPDDSTLYVANAGDDVIRSVNLATNQVTILAGAAGQSGAVDGVPTAARFNSPQTLATDAVGNLYVADSRNNLIRKIAVNTHTVTTLAGDPYVSGALDGFGSQAQLNVPQGITIDDAGDIYIADTYNHTIRVLQVGPAIVTQPASQTVKAGAAASFTVVASGAPNPTYQWFRGSTAIASATAATYNIPSAATADAGSYTVTITNTMNTVTSVPATLTVTATASSTTTPPAPTPNNNSGGGGGGAPSLYFLSALAALISARLRKQKS